MPMSPIVEYKDHRQYILDYYHDRKRRGAFTWRAFAAQAGFGSPVYLKLVCDGKKNLSVDAVDRVIKAMSLSAFEAEYFRAMVAFNYAKDEDAQKAAADQMLLIASTHKVKVLGADEFKYFDSWENPVLRELAPAMPGAKPLEIARVCSHGITAAQVSEALHFLVHAGFLNKDENGNYTQTDKSISSGTADFVPLAVRKMHRQMGGFAMDALEDLPVRERQFTGLTMGVANESYARILKELADCRQRIMAIVTETDKTDRVYRLNMQFFPLTNEIHGGGDGAH